jgi:hypothetical protein
MGHAVLLFHGGERCKDKIKVLRGSGTVVKNPAQIGQAVFHQGRFGFKGNLSTTAMVYAHEDIDRALGLALH